MSTYNEQARELETQISELAEKTNYDTNQIWVDAQIAIQEKYNLPSFHVWETGYCQGDASDDEVFEAKDSIIKIEEGDSPAVYAEWDNEDDSEILTDVYEFLDQALLEQVEIEILKVKKANWIKVYEDDIREFLNENYFTTGSEIGVDYSVYINIETGKIFEKTEASSNWIFQEDDENRKLILHMDNFEKPFNDFTDLIAEGSDSTISENLGIELPEGWEEMEYVEKVDWARENAQESIENYDSIQREEMIDTIMNLIEDEI